MRTSGNAETLAACASCEGYIVEGGLDAWAAAGLPVRVDSKQPIELMRQVQITAGALVLAGVLLGAYVAPGWYGLSGILWSRSRLRRRHRLVRHGKITRRDALEPLNHCAA